MTPDPASRLSPAARVRAVLDAAAAPVDPAPLPGEVEALRLFRGVGPASPRPWRTHVRSRTTTRLVTGTAVAGLVLVGGGVAAATTGLPGPAADAARAALAKAGITVTTGSHSSDHPTAPASSPAPAASHGASVSELARTTTETGAAKGAAVSDLASGGRARAGGAAATPTASAASHRTTTGATASGGHATVGAGNATAAPTPPAHP